MIGVVGGMGPHAGLDLVAKVFAQTLASQDQDHLPLALLSVPSEIPDRTRFLLGQESRNPALVIARILQRLEELGATVAGIPCNTSHTPRIFQSIGASLRERGSRLRLLDMIEETVRFTGENLPNGGRVGLLSTYGTHRAGTYRHAFRGSLFTPVALSDVEMSDLVHTAIYHPDWGLKACPDPVKAEARERLFEACRRLELLGAQAVILGCTELPFAFRHARVSGMLAIDPAVALARALIRNVEPARLKPFHAESPAQVEAEPRASFPASLTA